MFQANIFVGGQIRGVPPRMFMIYPEGNFVESGPNTPYFQLGDTKYGKPILARANRPDLTFEHAIKPLIISFDSTFKSNLSVGLPLDLSVYAADTLAPGPTRRFAETDPRYRTFRLMTADLRPRTRNGRGSTSTESRYRFRQRHQVHGTVRVRQPVRSGGSDGCSTYSSEMWASEEARHKFRASSRWQAPVDVGKASMLQGRILQPFPKRNASTLPVCAARMSTIVAEHYHRGTFLT